MKEPFQIRFLERYEEQSIWKTLVDTSHGGTFYHSSNWLDTIRSLVSEEVAVLGFFQKGCLLGGIPIQIRKKGFFTLAQRPFATPYNNPVFCDSCFEHPREFYSEIAARFSRIVVTFSPFSPLLASGLAGPRRLRETFVLDIGDVDRVWHSLSFEVRNRIRKAEKNGVVVHRNSRIDDFYSLYMATLERQHLSVPFDQRTFRMSIEHLCELDCADSYVACTDSGYPCASCLIVRDKMRSYYSFAASDRELRKNGAPSLLMWEAIKDSNLHVEVFDCGGANIPTIKQFKSKFNGQSRKYTEHWLHRSKCEQFCVESYQRFRKFLTKP